MRMSISNGCFRLVRLDQLSVLPDVVIPLTPPPSAILINAVRYIERYKQPSKNGEGESNTVATDILRRFIGSISERCDKPSANRTYNQIAYKYLKPASWTYPVFAIASCRAVTVALL